MSEQEGKAEWPRVKVKGHAWALESGIVFIVAKSITMLSKKKKN